MVAFVGYRASDPLAPRPDAEKSRLSLRLLFQPGLCSSKSGVGLMKDHLLCVG